MRALILCVCVVTGCLTQGQAQQKAGLPESNGTVVGRVFLEDNNLPARFAHVTLQAAPALRPANAPGEEEKAAGKGSSAGSAPSVGTSSTVETNLDGSFALHDVKVGDYFVVVEKAGYISPRTMFSDDDLSDPAPAKRELVDRAMHRVRVDANATVRASITLQRGAAVSGTVLFDDGSPAGEMEVHLLHKDRSGEWERVDMPEMPNWSQVITDDRGHYRIADLLGDEYMLQTRMNLQVSKERLVKQGGQFMGYRTRDSLFDLSFYGRGEVTADAAKSFTIRVGQERTGEDVTIPLAKLHRLTGRVLAGADAHQVNAARIVLLTAEDGEEMASTTISRDDGLFHFEFVPASRYTLRVEDARDVTWQPGDDPSHGMGMPVEDKEITHAAFGNMEVALDLSGDLDGFTVTVPRK